MSDVAKSLLDFIPAEAKARLIALSQLQTDARAHLERVREAVVDAEEDLKDQERLSKRRDAMAAALSEALEARAAAKALGEPPPKDMPSAKDVPAPVDTSALRQTVQGLRRRLEEAEQRVKDAEAEFRSAQVQELLVNGRRNATKRWVELAKECADVWLTLDAAESLEAALYGGGQLGVEVWGQFRMPGSTSTELPELRAASEETMSGAQVFDAQNARQRGFTVKALSTLATTFRAEIGEWTLDRRR